jgi:hypothetical protein
MLFADQQGELAEVSLQVLAVLLSHNSITNVFIQYLSVSANTDNSNPHFYQILILSFSANPTSRRAQVYV